MGDYQYVKTHPECMSLTEKTAFPFLFSLFSGIAQPPMHSCKKSHIFLHAQPQQLRTARKATTGQTVCFQIPDRMEITEKVIGLQKQESFFLG